MLVTARDINPYDPLLLLDEMNYLSEEYSQFPAMMVPVYGNDEVGKDLINLDKFCQFAESNNIDDIGYAIAEVCKVNEVKLDNLGFIVEETACYANDDIADVAFFLRENGYHVYLAPISSENKYYRALKEAFELDAEQPNYASSPYLQAYCEDIALNENIFEDGRAKLGQAGDWVVDKAGAAKQKVIDAGRTIKSTATSGVDALSKKFAAAKKTYQELKAKLSRTAGEAKAFLSRQVAKAKEVMDSLKAKLIQAKNFVGDKASAAGSAISNGASSVKNGAIGAKNWVADKAGAAKQKVFG